MVQGSLKATPADPTGFELSAVAATRLDKMIFYSFFT